MGRGLIGSPPDRTRVHGAWPGDVWYTGWVGNNNGEKTGHPAQFSERFALQVIEMYSNAGSLVCDPFSGSGTVQKVCLENCRVFVGADPLWADLREMRMTKVQPATYRPFPGVTPESAAFFAAELARERAETMTATCKPANTGGKRLRGPWNVPVRRVDSPAFEFDRESQPHA